MRIQRGLILLLATFILSGCSTSPKQLDENGKQWHAELARLSKDLEGMDQDLEKVIYLRNYVGGLADLGFSPQGEKDFFHQQKWDSLFVPQAYQIFKNDSLPANCYPTAKFYNYLLRYFGMPCFTYSFNVEGIYGHTFSVISIEHQGQEMLTAQDAYYCMGFADSLGNPVHFPEMLSQIHKRDFSNIHRKKDSVDTRVIVLPEILEHEQLNDSCKQEMLQLFAQKTKHPHRFKMNRNYEYMIENACESFGEKMLDALQNQGYPRHDLLPLILNNSIGGPDVDLYCPQIQPFLIQTPNPNS